MDIKMKLEDSKVLDISSETKKFLNSKGVYTIEDFLNFNESDIPVTRSNYYLAMQHIFRHAYLHQELVYDVLLDKEYATNKRGIKEFGKDYLKLGLSDQRYGITGIYHSMEKWIQSNKEFLTSDKISMKVILEMLVNRNNIRKKLFDSQNDHFDKTKVEKLQSQMSKYPDINVIYPSILEYYIYYIDTKIEIKDDTNDNTYTLMYLKQQLSQLVSQRDNLDKQIEVLQNKVAEIIGENKSHGK